MSAVASNPYAAATSQLRDAPTGDQAPSVEQALSRGCDFTIGGLLSEAWLQPAQRQPGPDHHRPVADHHHRLRAQLAVLHRPEHDRHSPHGRWPFSFNGTFGHFGSIVPLLVVAVLMRVPIHLGMILLLGLILIVSAIPLGIGLIWSIPLFVMAMGVLPVAR